MADIKSLMGGIAVVIDDALPPASTLTDDEAAEDLIHQIVDWFEREWALPFLKSPKLPKEAHWSNLLQAANFVLLDWRLWGNGGDELKRRTIEEIIEFLKLAKENVVPVFIFSNEAMDEIYAELPNDVYDESDPSRSLFFVGQKDALWTGESVKVIALDNWVHENASVYALKTWERVLGSAKRELFLRMLNRSVDWPHVFWNSYVEDGANPSASLTNLINDSLTGRMRMDAFEAEYLGGEHRDVSGYDLRGLIVEASFRPGDSLPEDEIRCGDLYKGNGRKYLLNLRPDCDCIPRNGDDLDEIEVHCIKGKKLRPNEVRKLFNNGHFEERVFQSVVFAVADGKSILFDFNDFVVMKYLEVKAMRVGRLLHPYVTRVQQRYALYAQRQALPRIPDAAVLDSQN